MFAPRHPPGSVRSLTSESHRRRRHMYSLEPAMRDQTGTFSNQLPLGRGIKWTLRATGSSLTAGESHRCRRKQITPPDIFPSGAAVARLDRMNSLSFPAGFPTASIVDVTDPSIAARLNLFVRPLSLGNSAPTPLSDCPES